MIPSPIAVMQLDRDTHGDRPWGSMNRTVNPPLATSYFQAHDEGELYLTLTGSASPRFIRLTTNNLPASDELQRTCAIPMALVVQPLADCTGFNEMPPPLIDTPSGPVRCGRCKGYINPFCIFSDGGRKFTCNLCLFENQVSQDYFCNLDMSGRRLDLDTRPELIYGSVDWIATPEYCSRPPAPVSYLFCLDVSATSIANGMLMHFVECFKNILYSPKDGSCLLAQGTRVGIMTFDRCVHFYNLSPGLDQAQMMIVSDTEDVFVPLHTGLFVDPVESRFVCPF